MPMQKFRKGERVAHTGYRHGTKGTVIDCNLAEGPLPFNEYEVHWDNGGTCWMTEEKLESIEGREGK